MVATQFIRVRTAEHLRSQQELSRKRHGNENVKRMELRCKMTDIDMKIDNLESIVEKLYEAKDIIRDVKTADEDTYYYIPETERDERMYHNINTLDIMEDYLNEMINDLNKMVKEQVYG